MYYPDLSRYSASACAAVVVTGGLLFAMQALIATKGAPLLPSVNRILPLITRMPPEPMVTPRDKPHPVEPPAPPPTRTKIIDGGMQRVVEVQVNPPVAPQIDFRTQTQGAHSAALTPIVKVAAVYPQRALAMGLAGYVIVEFTVTASGSVDDLQIVESSDRIFEANALAAARKFRYRPRIVDGLAVATPGVLNRITFEIEP